MNVVYVGYDAREADAYRVCCASLRAHARERMAIQPINSRFLGSSYYRPEVRKNGVRWDVISNAPMATEFALARFFVPMVERSGWALFCDGDFMFRAPVEELFALADPKYAVMVVKHKQGDTGTAKMDGQVQTSYDRKNWSSLMLWNCAHPASQNLDVGLLNSVPGLYLHQFTWMHSDQIGELPLRWNWLEGISDPSVEPAAVHFTRGVPSMKGYENSAYADEWRQYARG